MVQAGFGILSNSYLKGFAEGTIYKGPLKNFCVPGMNCYSCPGALGACPIGAMQSVFDGRRRKFAFYVVGYLALIGLVAGRFVCGWLCLFGLLQELLYKIPSPKLKVPDKADMILRRAKYFFLVVFVFALPFFWRSGAGPGDSANLSARWERWRAGSRWCSSTPECGQRRASCSSGSSFCWSSVSWRRSLFTVPSANTSVLWALSTRCSGRSAWSGWRWMKRRAFTAAPARRSAR